jgi:hypothetical protein
VAPTRALLPTRLLIVGVSHETKQEQESWLQQDFHPVKFIFTRRNSGKKHGVGMTVAQ